jgi:hypothetical protein
LRELSQQDKFVVGEALVMDHDVLLKESLEFVHKYGRLWIEQLEDMEWNTEFVHFGNNARLMEK